MKHKMPEQDPKIRATNFEEVAMGYSEEDAVAEVIFMVAEMGRAFAPSPLSVWGREGHG